MYENCNNILVAAKRDKDNTFLEPYASLISVCVQGLAELIWPQSMCVQVLAKLICESVGIQIVRKQVIFVHVFPTFGHNLRTF